MPSKRNPRELEPHPLQSQYFPDESEEADLELAADMGANGQKDPIEILPDGTILCGHRRTKAAIHLEWETIDVVVHHELANDKAAAEALFIGDNYNRRQLTNLQKVRCAARRVELAKQGKVALSEECDGLKKTRDKIGMLLGKSGRLADRYLRVLKTPIEVQHAFDGGHLSLVEADKVAGFSEEMQEEIAAQLRDQGLESAKTIFDDLRPSKAVTRRGAESIWHNLRRELVESVNELPGNVSNIGFMNQEDMELLDEVEDLLCEVRCHASMYLEDDDD